MSNQHQSDFFVGSERELSFRVRRFLYNRLTFIFAVAFLLAALLPAFSDKGIPSFSGKNTICVEGILLRGAEPILLVPRKGIIPPEIPPYSIIFPVTSCREGLRLDVPNSEANMAYVRVTGYPVFNRMHALLNVTDMETVPPLSVRTDLPEVPAFEDRYVYGTVSLDGEIVSAACFAGMNPGFGKAQRASTIRSLDSRIPPLLLIRANNGDFISLWIVGEEGTPIGTEISEWAGRPVTIKGEASMWMDKLILRTRKEWINERNAP